MNCNNSSDLLLDFPLFMSVNRVIFVEVAYPLIVLGIITSTLTLLLLSRDRETFVSTRFLLSCLAASDMGYLCFNFIIGIFTLVTSVNTNSFIFIFNSRHLCEFMRNWLLTVLSFERFLFFYDPLKFETRWGLNGVRAVVITLTFLGLLCETPNVVYIAALIILKDCEILRLSRNFQSLLNLLTVTTLPLVCMAIFSVLTTKIVTDLMHRMFSGTKLVTPSRTTVKGSKNAMKIIRNSLIVFAITSIPSVPTYCITFHLVYWQKTDDRTVSILTVLHGIASLLSIVNSICNFFIFILQSSRYRRILVDLFRVHCVKPPIKSS